MWAGLPRGVYSYVWVVSNVCGRLRVRTWREQQLVGSALSIVDSPSLVRRRPRRWLQRLNIFIIIMIVFFWHTQTMKTTTSELTHTDIGTVVAIVVAFVFGSVQLLWSLISVESVLEYSSPVFRLFLKKRKKKACVNACVRACVQLLTVIGPGKKKKIYQISARSQLNGSTSPRTDSSASAKLG